MIPKRRKPKRTKPYHGPIRNPNHLKWIRGHECAIGNGDCQGRIEAAHVRTGTDGGIAMKPGDCYTIPLCSHHHAEQHNIGEGAFERKYHQPGWMRETADRLWRTSPHRIKTERKD